MKRIKVLFGIFLAATVLTACVKDLEVKPKDPNTILSGNLGDDPAYMKQVLGKIYASYIIAGQGANGGPDISAPDENFFTTCRALWNLQEITTDEAICAWGDVGIADLNTQTWSAQNPFLTALYQRLSLTITYANDFIKFTNGNTNPDVQRYNAEARFLRALAYYYHMDLFGNPPFTTDKDGVGKYYPKQLDENFAEGRKKLFNYVVSELKAISPKLAAPGRVSTQANRAAAWMLLARTYLNSEVYTGVPKWDSCKMYCDSVINSGAYSLATNYRQNFTADNNYPANPEMILAWEQDGVHTQGYVGTTFIIESSSDATYIRAEDYHGLTSNTNWNGNRARLQFVEKMLGISNPGWGEGTDLRALYPADSRIYLKVKKQTDIPAASSSGDYGIGVYKFTARNLDGTKPATYNPAFACTDFPVFRLADAYMMRAEANFRLGNTNGALDDINYIRDRAFKGGTFGSTPTNTYRLTTLTLDDILNERAREFYYEAQRRTDLVRFGKFTGGSYLWAWKGGVSVGTSTPSHLNVFPIPAAEVSANPFIKQNPNY